MNINKLDTALCFAFTQSADDNVFDVSVIYENKDKKFLKLNKLEISFLSEKDNVQEINLLEIIPERRWITRWGSDRRKVNR